jgi:hypothetical protein
LLRLKYAFTKNRLRKYSPTVGVMRPSTSSKGVILNVATCRNQSDANLSNGKRITTGSVTSRMDFSWTCNLKSLKLKNILSNIFITYMEGKQKES